MPYSVAIEDPLGKFNMRTEDGRDIKADYYDLTFREIARDGQAKPWHYNVTLEHGRGKSLRVIPVGQVFHRARSNGWDTVPHNANHPSIWGFQSRIYAAEYMLRGVKRKVYQND